MDHSAAGSSTSPRKPSRRSRRSEPASSRSASTGSDDVLGRGALRALAARHGIRPSKSLGQNFLTDPNLARRIAALSGAAAADKVLEIGAGLGSLTVALAGTGASVLAVESDPRLLGALEEVVGDLARVELRAADAMKEDWPRVLRGHRWRMVSNLPYNVGTPLVIDMLRASLPIDLYLIMVQREVGERLAASPGSKAYGAVSLRVAYHAEASLLRRVPADVFWPKPSVESVLVRLIPRARPPVDADPEVLFRLVREGFAQRRKTMANAFRRQGLSADAASGLLASCGLDPKVRAEQLGLQEFAAMADAMEGVSDG